MNGIHRWICRSAGWRRALESAIVPWTLDGADLGDQILETGPGPGLTTDILRNRYSYVTALEIDAAAAAALDRRTRGSNVTAVHGSATQMPFEDARFSGVVSFTMLHHVPSPALQDKLFAEVYRVLRPGGVFAGTDSKTSWAMRLIHIGDTLVPVPVETLGARLQAAGFRNVEVQSVPRRFRFIAKK